MDASLQGFRDIAPCLTHPLVLIGFLLLQHDIHRRNCRWPGHGASRKGSGLKEIVTGDCYRDRCGGIRNNDRAARVKNAVYFWRAGRDHMERG